MIFFKKLFNESNGRPLTGIQPLNREILVSIALTSLWNLLGWTMSSCVLIDPISVAKEASTRVLQKNEPSLR